MKSEPNWSGSPYASATSLKKSPWSGEAEPDQSEKIRERELRLTGRRRDAFELARADVRLRDAVHGQHREREKRLADDSHARSTG
jgi:hypothetical protein